MPPYEMGIAKNHAVVTDIRHGLGALKVMGACLYSSPDIHKMSP
jgi:hypothetical protein